ncbi:MAG TPA: hypothetical protein VFI28_07060 [Candidatus Limnocylindrales bacterium]|nr:hypothetical protein [Candidatus Limnocylindrales bacterium]
MTSDAVQSGGTDAPAAQRQLGAQLLTAEYGALAGALSAVWMASLTRTSLFLGVLSAVGVALGFVAQAGGGVGATFTLFALVTLPLALLLGLATFVRLIEVQREAIVYIAGMNRIRHFFAESAPMIRPYLVLSTHDDEAGIYRSQGTGIRLRAPRYRLVFALVQTQGIVGVVCAVLAACTGGIAAATVSVAVGWVVGAIAFVVIVVALFGYWNRSISEIEAALRPLNPSPETTEPPTI